MRFKSKTRDCTYSGSLPPTAYVKMVDAWLLFAQSIPFVEVFIYLSIFTSIYSYIYPSIYLLFLFIYLSINILYIYLSTYLSNFNSSIYLSLYVYLSLYISIHLSIYLSIQVLLHTFIDSMRLENDRTINHHGKGVKVILVTLELKTFHKDFNLDTKQYH